MSPSNLAARPVRALVAGAAIVSTLCALVTEARAQEAPLLAPDEPVEVDETPPMALPAPPPPPAPRVLHPTFSLGASAGSLYGIAHAGGEGRLGMGIDARGLRLEVQAAYARLGTPSGVPLDLVSAGIGAALSRGRLHGGLASDLSVLGFSRGTTGSYVSSLGLGLYGHGGVDLLRMDVHALSLDVRAGAMFFAAAVVPEAKAGLVLTY